MLASQHIGWCMHVSRYYVIQFTGNAPRRGELVGAFEDADEAETYVRSQQANGSGDLEYAVMNFADLERARKEVIIDEERLTVAERSRLALDRLNDLMAGKGSERSSEY